MTNKPYRGKILEWGRDYFDREKYRKLIQEETLGYIVYGYRDGHTLMRTSPVIYYDEYTNEIETLNSRYLLVGDCLWNDFNDGRTTPTS